MILDHLKAIVILKDLDDRSIRSIEHFFNTRVFKAGECILTYDSEIDFVMALCSGLVRVSLTTPHAKEMVIRDIKTGELFGDWAAIDGQPRSARVVAIQDSIVALIKKADFQALVTHHPHIALRQMQELTKQLRAMSWRLTEFVAMKANLRVQSVMLDFTVQTPEGLLIQKMAGHQEIAARAFTQREVVAREITALQKEGILLRYNDGFLIPDPERLELLQARKTYKNH